MLYVATWFAVIVLLALWSLAIWAAHAAAVWTVEQAADLSGTVPAFDGLSLPEPMAAWLPPEVARALEALGSSLGPLVGRLLQSVPALSEVLSVVSWAAWGLGTVLIVLLGAGLHLLIALWRRRGGGPGTGPVLAAG